MGLSIVALVCSETHCLQDVPSDGCTHQEKHPVLAPVRPFPLCPSYIKPCLRCFPATAASTPTPQNEPCCTPSPVPHSHLGKYRLLSPVPLQHKHRPGVFWPYKITQTPSTPKIQISVFLPCIPSQSLHEPIHPSSHLRSFFPHSRLPSPSSCPICAPPVSTTPLSIWSRFPDPGAATHLSLGTTPDVVFDNYHPTSSSSSFSYGSSDDDDDDDVITGNFLLNRSGAPFIQSESAYQTKAR